MVPALKTNMAVVYILYWNNEALVSDKKSQTQSSWRENRKKTGQGEKVGHGRETGQREREGHQSD